MANRKVWVTSDTHFGHFNIIKYGNRPFNNLYEMNETLSYKWNSVVGADDLVYHLGDVYFDYGEGTTYWQNYLSNLNGTKRLILGNHDSGKSKVLKSIFQKIEMWKELPDLGLLLTHVPVHPSILNDGRHNTDLKAGKWKNVHGHTHLGAEPDEDTKNYKCVCVELTGYKPVRLDSLRVT